MTQTLRFDLNSPIETSKLAENLGSRLRVGDVILLSGEIGAGKTLFARALIQSLQDAPEDVPSPSFTLVQVYDTRAGEIWHSDLYRLSEPDQCVELGLLDAFETAICLVEWPDRLGDLIPDTALFMKFSAPPPQTGFDSSVEETHRQVDIAWKNDSWTQRIKDLV